MNKQSSKMIKQSSKMNKQSIKMNKKSSKMNKQSSTMNVRQYNVLFLCLPLCIVWYSFFCSVYPILLSDIHFTALFTSLYCLTFTLLLCWPHCIVWHSFYCSVYPIVLSDIHFTALFTSLYCLTFIVLLCLFILLLLRKMNERQNKEVNRAVKWMSDNTMR
jgi:Flp pilus assembly protein TadB